MYSLSCCVTDLSRSWESGRARITFETPDAQTAYKIMDNLGKEKRLVVKIDKYREKRSRNANNYAWALITEIANKTGSGKDQVYLMMLKRYGQSEMISVLEHIPIESYVKYSEEAGQSKLNGKTFKHYRVYKGSSEFDTKEMSIFIDGVISEAKELHIPTETPDQIAKMKSLWGE